MGEIFKDHVIAAAVLDRILHHCSTINIKGESYRLKGEEKTGSKNGTYTYIILQEALKLAPKIGILI